MEFWKYIEILNNRKGVPFLQKKDTKAKLEALNKILEIGQSNAICNLIPFLKDTEKEIQQAVCNAIIELFKKIETKKGYYENLKHCDILRSDLNWYILGFSAEQQIYLLAVASLNRSGYIREEAVKLLAETSDKRAIPFIVFRLTDWVRPVRENSLRAIEKFKTPAFTNALIENLALFEWLQKVQRTDLSSVYNDIMDYIIIENRPYIIESFKSFSDKSRFLIANRLCNSENILSEDLRLFMRDKHFLVRNLSLKHFNKLTQDDVNTLLKDKSSRIRLQTLNKLKDDHSFLTIVYPFLGDTSASIREFSRYFLKVEIIDFATIYAENLRKNISIIGSIIGLSETGGVQFKDALEPFLNDSKSRIRKTAFITLTKLDPDKAYYFALKNLGTEYISLRNSIIDFLSRNATTEVLQTARKIYSNGRYDSKKSMLKFFSLVGRWSAIADIIIGTIDENENIRQLSLTYLEQWRNKASTYYTEPKAGELERANQIFRFAFEIHEERKFYKHNPLIGIDFYLR